MVMLVVVVVVVMTIRGGEYSRCARDKRQKSGDVLVMIVVIVMEGKDEREVLIYW